MANKQFLRYLAPNLVTMASLLFGMMSIVSSVQGDFAMAAWFVLFSVLTDKLDGFIARLVKGESDLGVQLDSFADFLNYGIAPATLWYTFLTRPRGPLDGSEAVVMVSCALWVLAITFRLARYNVVGDDPRCKRIFFGVPTTLMGGTLTALFLAFLKYGEGAEAASFAGEPRLLGGLVIPEEAWQIWPVLLVVGALLMASNFRIPKLGRSKNKFLTVFIFANVLAGYTLAVLRQFPEYLFFLPWLWIAISLIWGAVNREVRQLKAPRIFPKREQPVPPVDDEEAHVEEPHPVRSARG